MDEMITSELARMDGAIWYLEEDALVMEFLEIHIGTRMRRAGASIHRAILIYRVAAGDRLAVGTSLVGTDEPPTADGFDHILSAQHIPLEPTAEWRAAYVTSSGRPALRIGKLFGDRAEALRERVRDSLDAPWPLRQQIAGRLARIDV